MNIGVKIAGTLAAIGAGLWFVRFQLGKFIPDFVVEIGNENNAVNKAAATWYSKYVSSVENFFGLAPGEKLTDKVLGWFSGSPSANVHFSKLVDSLVTETSKSHGVPANILAAVIKVESNGDPTVTGDNGKARGLMQVQKIALDDVNSQFRTSFFWNNMYMAEENIKVGANFLMLQKKRMGNWNDAIRAYNAGEGGANNGLAFDYLAKVQRWI